MAVKVSAGTAYVRGYDVDLEGSTVLDVEKPRIQKQFLLPKFHLRQEVF